MHVDSDIALLGRRLARMQSDPNANRPRRKPTLDLLGSSDGIRSPRERNEEGVTLRIHLHPAVGGESGAQHTTVLRERGRILLAEFVQQPVDPSMSLKRKVTVPEGRSRIATLMMRLVRAFVESYDPERRRA